MFYLSFFCVFLYHASFSYKEMDFLPKITDCHTVSSAMILSEIVKIQIWISNGAVFCVPKNGPIDIFVG